MLETTIHKEAAAALNRLHSQHPELGQELENAHGYAVFPSVGRAGLVLGGAYGHGEVYEQGQPAGFATLSQITVGVQVGGQTFTEVVLFNEKEAFDEFKHRGRLGFSANASAVILKAAASGTTNFDGVVAHAYSAGGMLLEVSLGGSKMMFIPPMEKRDEQEKGAEQQKTEDEGMAPAPASLDIIGGVAGKAMDKLSFIPGVGRIVSSLRKEKAVGDTLHKDVQAALTAIRERNQGVGGQLEKAYGYAVFPALGGARAVLGAATGKGEVFEQGKLVGYSQLVQVTIGVQLGGQTFTEVVLFSDKAALDLFKQGRVSFAANAAAVIVKAGAVATTNYKGLETLAFSEGGLLIELGLGAQKFYFKPAALTRGKSDEQEYGGEQAETADSSKAAGDQREKGQPKKDQAKEQRGSRVKEAVSRKIGRFGVEVVQ
jgi:lipid-binding SYLF domain-containing protein